MECAAHVISTDYYRDFCDKASVMRVPLSGSLEITHRCNLRCVHCYVGTARYSKDLQREEMGKDQIFRLLDEICDAGCLHLLITGGEPLMRPDFL